MRAAAARPLEGVRVIVTRALGQSARLSELLEARGAQPLEVPVIEIVEPSDGGEALQIAAQNIASYDWVIFSSVNAVEHLMARCDAGIFDNVRVAAIGAGTAKALRDRRVNVSLIPEEFVSESLVEAFSAAEKSNSRVLLVKAEVGRDVLAQGLAAKGYEVDEVAAYRTVPASVPPETRKSANSADVVTFTSSSTVTNYVKSLGTGALPNLVICIGPITAETAEKEGIEVHAVAKEHTIDALVEAVVDAWENRNNK